MLMTWLLALALRGTHFRPRKNVRLSSPSNARKFGNQTSIGNRTWITYMETQQFTHYSKAACNILIIFFGRCKYFAVYVRYVIT